MNTLIETSIQLLGYGRGPSYITIFNINDPSIKKIVNYVDVTSASGKKAMVLFSYNNGEEIKDVAVEIYIPKFYNDVSVKDYVISELKNILKNVD